MAAVAAGAGNVGRGGGGISSGGDEPYEVLLYAETEKVDNAFALGLLMGFAAMLLAAMAAARAARFSAASYSSVTPCVVPKVIVVAVDCARVCVPLLPPLRRGSLFKVGFLEVGV